MKINKRNLLVIASFVWMIAGFNVMRIGIITYAEYITTINVVLTILIFVCFHFLIFQKMVVKHCQRIMAYTNKQYFWKFFDLKSFLIMLFMISFGIIIRIFNLLPDRFIAVFYTGLGLALFLAGVVFGLNYLKLLNKEIVRFNMKKYIDFSIFYTLIALVAGVFYREFTKYNGFTLHTSLAVIHTHYLILGAFFFLILIIFDKLFDVSKNISNKLLSLYHIGLNLSCFMMLVRGIIQVKAFQLSNEINASIAGVAGLGHVVLTISIIFILYKLKKSILDTAK